MDVYIETGKKRTFASAVEWPGWSRSGRNESAALDALLDSAPRYARALRGTRLGFRPPTALEVVERLGGTATTDFGAPDVAPSSDGTPIGDAELRRLRSILRASWRTFDAAVGAASGTKLRTGPRGGGRDLGRIVEHVQGAEASYFSMIGGRLGKAGPGDPADELERTRRTVLDAFTSAVRNGVPASGPRGGKRWAPRYFVRRAAWHVLDHAWEIEDRTE
jgi:hypothetical protein